MLIDSILASKPTTSTEWMMMTDEVEPLDDTEHQEVVAAALAQMGEQSKFILMAVFYERIAYEELGSRLGVSKTHAWRLTRKAIEELRALLTGDPILTRRYKLYTTWDDACASTVDSFMRSKARQPDDIVEYARAGLINCFQQSIDPASASLYALAVKAVEELKKHDITNPSTVTEFLVGKQYDYGHGNISTFGLKGVIVRLVDKIARLENLQRRPDPTNESIVDTWLDIFGYCVVGTMLIDETFQLPLREDLNEQPV